MQQRPDAVIAQNRNRTLRPANTAKPNSTAIMQKRRPGPPLAGHAELPFKDNSLEPLSPDPQERRPPLARSVDFDRWLDNEVFVVGLERVVLGRFKINDSTGKTIAAIKLDKCIRWRSDSHGLIDHPAKRILRIKDGTPTELRLRRCIMPFVNPITINVLAIREHPEKAFLGLEDVGG